MDKWITTKTPTHQNQKNPLDPLQTYNGYDIYTLGMMCGCVFYAAINEDNPNRTIPSEVALQHLQHLD